MKRIKEVMKSPRERQKFFWRLSIIFLVGLILISSVVTALVYWAGLPSSLADFAIFGYIALSVFIGNGLRRLQL